MPGRSKGCIRIGVCWVGRWADRWHFNHGFRWRRDADALFECLQSCNVGAFNGHVQLIIVGFEFVKIVRFTVSDVQVLRKFLVSDEFEELCQRPWVFNGQENIVNYRMLSSETWIQKMDKWTKTKQTRKEGLLGISKLTLIRLFRQNQSNWQGKKKKWNLANVKTWKQYSVLE